VLILRRRVGEAILVGSEVEIEVIEVSRSRVKLGVRAPTHITVTRKETLAVAQENQLASDLIASGGPEVVGELLGLLGTTDSGFTTREALHGVAGKPPGDSPGKVGDSGSICAQGAPKGDDM